MIPTLASKDARLSFDGIIANLQLPSVILLPCTMSVTEPLLVRCGLRVLSLLLDRIDLVAV